MRTIVSDFMSISDLCFDASGRNIWVHDCKVWNQDDSVAVKDDSENVLIERIEASGIGLAIGSIGCNTVNNVTFRDVHMHHTWKGIYLKFRGCQDKNYTAKISNVYFENIYMDAPEQFAIWIGPAQVSKLSLANSYDTSCLLFDLTLPKTTCFKNNGTYTRTQSMEKLETLSSSHYFKSLYLYDTLFYTKCEYTCLPQAIDRC